MTDHQDYLNEQIQDGEFKNEWDAIEPEFTIIQAMIDAGKTATTGRRVCRADYRAEGLMSKMMHKF